MGKPLIKEDNTQVDQNIKKKFSTPFAIREMQIKNTVCYHNIPTKMTNIGEKKDCCDRLH